MDNLRHCDFSKTVLMILVVLCHSVAFYGGDWFTVCGFEQKNIYLGSLASWLGTFHVEAFTLISGYVYYFIKQEKQGYNKYSVFLLNKIKRLLVPYFAMSLLWVIPLSNTYYDYSCKDIIHKYLLGESPSQLWFLLMLFNVFVIADAIISWLGRKIQMICVLVIFLASVILTRMVPNTFQILTSMRYLMFFYIGYILRMKCPMMESKKYFILGGGFLLLNLVSFVYSNIFFKPIHTRVFIFVCKNVCDISGAIMAFMLLSGIASKFKAVNQVSKLFENISFPIYLFHQQIIYIMLWHFVTKLPPFFMCCVCFIVSLIVSYLISEILVKNKYSRFLIGLK